MPGRAKSTMAIGEAGDAQVLRDVQADYVDAQGSRNHRKILTEAVSAAARIIQRPRCLLQ